MIWKAAALLVSLFMLLAAGFAQAPPAGAAASTAEYNAMVDQFFSAYFHFLPSDGTAAGFMNTTALLKIFRNKARG